VDAPQILSWADEAGLDRIDVQDRSPATLPSYRTVAPHAWDPTRRQASAGDVFRWLQASGWLAYPAFSFRRR
jgi:hypothetical protein